MPSPIVIFAFNRPEALERLTKALSKCPLYDESPRIVFVDGARNEHERFKVEKVIEIAHTITNDVRCSDVNRGLGASVIAGVTDIIAKHGRAIVLEDDLVPAPGFLLFMNQALNRYESDDRILSVCGYSLKVSRPNGYQADVYLGERSSSWGWATWNNRWQQVDWEVTDYNTFKNNSKQRHSFNRGGSDMAGMLDAYMHGRNHSWAIRFCYHQWRHHMFSIHPMRSLIDNQGFGQDATNCRQSWSRFKCDVDMFDYQSLTPPYSDICHWQMPLGLQANERILQQLRRYHSVVARLYSKLRNMFAP